MSTIFRRLSHKLSRELLPFVELYYGDIVSRNVLTLRIPSPFVIVIVVMVAVVILERSRDGEVSKHLILLTKAITAMFKNWLLNLKSFLGHTVRDNKNRIPDGFL
ncbi:hypothetical protein Tco_1156015 [Tanacetum coccineum]